jgi:hypothetical protein
MNKDKITFNDVTVLAQNGTLVIQTENFHRIIFTILFQPEKAKILLEIVDKAERIIR